MTKPDLMEEAVAQAMLADLRLQPSEGGEHGCLFDGPSPDLHVIVRGHVSLYQLARAAIEAMQPAIAAAEARGREVERERCAQICEDQKQGFLSPQYAFNQPLGSMMERFACDECAAAIRRGTP